MIHNLGWKGPSVGICMASSLVRHGCCQPGVELPLVEEYDLRACCKLASLENNRNWKVASLSNNRPRNFSHAFARKATGGKPLSFSSSGFRKITSLHLNPTWIQHPWCPWHLAETEQLKHCTNLRKKLIKRKPDESKKPRVVSRQPKIVPPKTIWKIYFPVPLVW